MTTIADPGLGTDRKVRRYDDVRHLLPDIDEPTPLVRARRVMPEVELFLKLEWLNPFGSIKDRAAARMLDDLERTGALEGKELVEASSGNTAIALAALAALSGRRLTVTIPDGVPEEKKVLLRMLGAEVWPTPDDMCPVDHPKDGAIALARSLAASEGGNRYVLVNQYENESNVAAHYETTGPELWHQTGGQIRYFFAGFGTCGTVTGVGRYLKEQDPGIRVVAMEPVRGHRIPGLKSFAEAKEPGILDRSVIDEVVTVDDDTAYAMTKRLFREEGLMVGPSTGAIVAAVSALGDEIDGPVVAVSPDGGQKYTSYFAEILGDEGLPGV